MLPLTKDTPKPLLHVAGKPLLDHIFSALPSEIDEAVIVVRYLSEKIQAYCKDNFHGRRIRYAEGSDRGTAYSFLAAEPFIGDERFLLVYGDEFPDSVSIVACLAHEQSILCFRAEDPWNHGVVTLRADGMIASIQEKPPQPKTDLISNGVMVLLGSIFGLRPKHRLGGEVYLTDMLDQQVRRLRVAAVISERAIGGISTPADIVRIERLLS